jgi:lysophospholipase L1-like esterase
MTDLLWQGRNQALHHQSSNRTRQITTIRRWRNHQVLQFAKLNTRGWSPLNNTDATSWTSQVSQDHKSQVADESTTSKSKVASGRTTTDHDRQLFSHQADILHQRACS